MDLVEANKYVNLVDQLDGKYKLCFDPNQNRFAFQKRQERSSKVIGMVLENGWDYIVTMSCGDVLNSPFGMGFEIHPRLCDSNEGQFQRFLGLARIGSTSGDAELEQRNMREVESDLCFLKDAEKRIYEQGFVFPNPNSNLSLT